MNESNPWRRQPRAARRDWKARAARFAKTDGDDGDPLVSMINLFDVSMALVVALILAAAGGGNLAQITAHMSQHDVTIVTNPGRPDMELIVKRGQKIERLRATGEQGWGRGERLGTAYRLESGEVVYVPDGEAQAAESNGAQEAGTPLAPAPTTTAPTTRAPQTPR
ncbi:MAG: DUF2149 domain-containing protein [Bryobacterales bacterium]